MKYQTEAAQTAKLIRVELKKAFPSIKFKVQSETYAGGDSVNIYYVNGVPTKEVEVIVNKYQQGHFNGMEDIYEYSNNIEGMPQVKFVFVNREVTQDHKEAKKQEIAKSYGIENINDQSEWYKKTGNWSDICVYRALQSITFA